MPHARLCRLAMLLASVFSCGCSSLGLSLFPTGHFLTDRAEAVVAASPASAPLPRERNKNVVDTHFLQPGDVLLIEPIAQVNEVRIPADQTVMVDGSVDLGGYGRLKLVGLSIESAEMLIEQTVFDRLDDDVDLERGDIDINVRLIEPVHRYYVLGEVNSPGAYSLRGFETVLDGILEAGGLTTQASMCEIILSRPTDPCSCRVTLPICYREITQLGDTTTNYQLRPGDRIYVATRGCCDEICFWKANESCEKCDRCQQSCGCGAMVPPTNPMRGVVAMAIAEPTMGLAAVDGSMVESMHRSDMDMTADGPVIDAGPGVNHPAAEGALEPTFPELMQPPQGYDLQSMPPQVTPESAGGIDRDGGNQRDGELDIEITPRQSRRFEPMWLK